MSEETSGSNSNCGNLFKGGVPTAPDVRRLIEAFGVPAEGELIPYAEIEKLIGTSRKTNRGGTVIWRWRQQLMRDHNVLMGCRPTGLVALLPEERVSVGRDRIVHGLRRMRRGTRIMETTDRDRLSPELRAEVDHAIRCSSAALLAARAEGKRVKVLLE